MNKKIFSYDPENELLDYKKRFEIYLFTTVWYFEENINHSALFLKYYIKIIKRD